MHFEKLSTSQIGFYSIRIRTLDTLCFHREIGEIAIVKIFHLSSFIKKRFHDNLIKWKENSFPRIDFF